MPLNKPTIAPIIATVVIGCLVGGLRLGFGGSWDIIGLFGLVLVWLVAAYYRDARRYRRLQEIGRRCSTRFVKVTKQQGYDAAYYTVYSEWTDPLTSKRYTFQSSALAADPTAAIQLNNGMVEVFLDPTRPKIYQVDTSQFSG